LDVDFVVAALHILGYNSWSEDLLP
jgi:hypothetical protein